MSLFTSLARIWLTRSIKPFHFTNEYDNELEYQSAKRLGLYVHIPFCRTLCSFCPYCKTLYDPPLAKRYVDALLDEISLVGRGSNAAKPEVTSLYFGGGSPALVAEDIGRIISALQAHFVITEGIGLELHPHDVTVGTLRQLRQAGVTKVSIGIQSFQPEYLELLGRKPIDLDEMFTALSSVPFETVSADFIFALPDQTIDHLTSDIELAFRHGFNHIAVYPFIDFRFTSRSFSKMRESEKKQLLYQLVDHCERKGYVRDSIWTFSNDGVSKYSSMTRENFLGFGCSATTLLEDQFKINTFHVEEYIGRIEHKQLPTALTLRFRLRERMVYYLFWTAYTMRVNTQSFSDFFGRSLRQSYRFELWLAQLLGWIVKEDNEYLMTTKGSYYYHYFEHFYTLSYIDQMWNLMRNDPFPEDLIIR